MAHGYLSPTDIRGQSTLFDQIVGGISSRIGKSSSMARKERAYASKKAAEAGTSLKDVGIGRGYFFQRALGSSFGGDRIARTRGRLESDPPAGRDPTGTQASRFRGGFDYEDTSDGVAAASPFIPVNPVNSTGEAGSSASDFFSKAAAAATSSAAAINPEVLGGPITPFTSSKKTSSAASSVIDVQATEISDLGDILGNIATLIVKTNNSSIAAIDGVQRSNVQISSGIQSLGQLQISIAEKAMQQQKLLQQNSQDHQEKMQARILAAREKSDFTPDDFSDSTTAEKAGNRFGIPGGFGGILSRAGDMMGDALELWSGRGLTRGGSRYQGSRRRLNRMRLGRMSRSPAGRFMQGATSRLGMNSGGLVARGGGNALAAGATKAFGTKGAMAFLRPVFKRIPIFGGLIDFAVSLALGEPLGRAAAKSVGMMLGAALGSLIPVPGVGTFLGGWAGDFVGGAIYDAISGSKRNSDKEIPSFAGGGLSDGPKSGYLSMMHGTELTLSGENSSEMHKIGYALGVGILKAQMAQKTDYAKLQALGFAQYAKDREKSQGSVWDKENNQGFFEWLFGKKEEDENPPPAGGQTPFSPDRSGPRTQGNVSHILPFGNPVFNSGFGPRNVQGIVASRFHGGQDFGVDAKSPVHVTEKGIVHDVNKSWHPHGTAVSVQHPDGNYTLYGHIDPAPGIKRGQQLRGGQLIGKVKFWPRGVAGNYRNDDNTHLHFERHEGGFNSKIDPTTYLNRSYRNSQATKTAINKNINYKQEFGSKSTEALSLIRNPSNYKMGHRVVVPNVGIVQRIQKPGGLFGSPSPGLKFYDMKGNVMSQIEWEALQQKIKKQVNSAPSTLPEVYQSPAGGRGNLSSSNSSRVNSTRDLLATSAVVSSNDRTLSSQPVFINMPVTSNTASGGGQSLPVSMAGSSANSITPGWLLNSVLS